MWRTAVLLWLVACGMAASEPPLSSPPLSSPPTVPSSEAVSAVPEAHACVGHVAQLPGVDSAEPRLSAAHLLVVRKSSRSVQLFRQGRAVEGTGMEGKACYKVGLGFAPEGHKQREGDGRTPEGWYRSSDKPWSSFHAAIAVHYPNADDAAAGLADQRISAAVARTITTAVNRREKPPQTTALGGEILLHGGGSSTDWTLGCIALNDPDIDALRALLPKNMRVDVRILP